MAIAFEEVDIKTVNSALGFTIGDKVKVIDKNYSIDKDLYVIFISEYSTGKYFFHCSSDKNAKVAKYYFGLNQIKRYV